MNYTYSQLKREFERLGYHWFNFHLIGIRSNEDKPNAFDDKFYLIEGVVAHEYTGTTNPGKHWLENPMQEKGTALLKPGQYINCWELGRHKGVYKAWTQCKPVTVFRDNDRDLKSEETNVQDTGLFGINIHRANENVESKNIDKWSAGCCVFNNPVQFKQFILLSEQSGLIYFTYTLLKEF